MMTVAKLYKSLGLLIEQGHERKPVVVNKPSFHDAREEDGCVLLDVHGIKGPRWIPMADDDSLQAECSVRLGKWTLASVTSCPEYDWRLVPPKPKTITIVANGKTYELPEPMRVAPRHGAEYFVYDHDCAYKQEWCVTSGDVDKLNENRCHATREAAQQWVDAMAEIRGAK